MNMCVPISGALEYKPCGVLCGDILRIHQAPVWSSASTSVIGRAVSGGVDGKGFEGYTRPVPMAVQTYSPWAEFMLKRLQVWVGRGGEGSPPPAEFSCCLLASEDGAERAGGGRPGASPLPALGHSEVAVGSRLGEPPNCQWRSPPSPFCPPAPSGAVQA